MSPEKKDPEISALEAVHAALKPLDPQTRRKVLASVDALLEIVPPEAAQAPATFEQGAVRPSVQTGTRPATRPLSLVELMQEKHPHTSPQKITLFAYYREKHESRPRFARENLKEYFSRAKEKPPANFDRDFVEAVKKGWLHEDDSESYITTKGIEAVELGFPSDGKPAGPARRPSRKRREPAKKRR